MNIKEMKEQLAALDKEVEPLRPLVHKYNTLCNQIYKLDKEIKKLEKEMKHRNITNRCLYQEPEYPGMGFMGSDGSAYFSDEEIAKSLMEVLRGDYSYAYILEWSGPGQYDVKPDWKRDHDGDVIYTATFKRSVEE